MNAGTLERLRAHVLPGVRGARTLLYNLYLALPSDSDDSAAIANLWQLSLSIDRSLVKMLHAARAERNATAKTRGTG